MSFRSIAGFRRLRSVVDIGLFGMQAFIAAYCKSGIAQTEYPNLNLEEGAIFNNMPLNPTAKPFSDLSAEAEPFVPPVTVAAKPTVLKSGQYRGDSPEYFE